MQAHPVVFAKDIALGRRKEQQDAAVMLTGPPCHLGSGGADMPAYYVFAVMDGHGSEGAKVAQWVEQQLVAWNDDTSGLVPQERSAETWCQVLKELIQRLATDLLDNDTIDCYLSGTTLTLVVVTHTHYILAQLGDSGALLLTHINGTWQSKKLNRDHTCQAPDELKRVQDSGARVERAIGSHGQTQSSEGPLRIYKGTLPYPGIVVTRSLGDAVATRLGVVAEPEFSVFPRNSGDPPEVLVVATDGVWDGLSLSQFPALLHGYLPTLLSFYTPQTAQNLAHEIVVAALAGLDRRAIDDNVTTICALVPPADHCARRG